MEFLRKFGMVLIGHRAFAIAGMAMIQATKEGCTFYTNTGMPFPLDHAEMHVLRQEVLNVFGGVIQLGNAKYESPFDCLRGYRWIVLPWCAINPAALSVIESIDGMYKLTLLGNSQVQLMPEDSAYFNGESMTLIWEAQRIAQSMK